MPNFIVKEKGFVELSARTQTGLLAALQAAGPRVEAAIKDEAPKRTGELEKAISLGRIIRFGPHRFQISVVVDLEKAPYYPIVIRGHGEIEAGEEGKIYSTGAEVWKGKFTLPKRPPNNFPKRAIRRVGPEITGLVARNFISRVKQ